VTLLADSDLLEALDDGRLTLVCCFVAVIQPASIDLHLDASFRAFIPHGETHQDPERPVDITRAVTASVDRPFVLHPGEFALGATLEVIGLADDLAARLEGRSSMGRLGLVVHSTAGFIDPGFRGQVTLELANLSPLPILLRPGLSVAQLCVIELSAPAVRPYGTPSLGSRYQGQRGPTASRAR
jgi:dCTP deaminase